VQQLAVDGIILAVILFHIERTPAGTGPSAELMGFQKRRATPASRPPSQSFPSPPMAHSVPSSASRSPGYLAGSPGYAFPAAPQLPRLVQEPGDLVGPGAGSSGHGALDNGSAAGLLGTHSSPGRMYYPQS